MSDNAAPNTRDVTRSLRWSRRAFIAVVVALMLVIAAGAIALSRGLLAGPSGPWRPAGLTGDTVHAIVEQHGTLFAATQDGVSLRAADGRWHLLLNVGTVWDLQALPDGRMLVAGDENGHVDISRDGGKTWTKHLVSVQGVYAVTMRPGVSGTILAGAGGGIYLSRDGGITWRRTLRLHNSAGAAFAWSGAGTLFAGVVAGGPGGDTRVYASRDAGLHWRVSDAGWEAWRASWRWPPERDASTPGRWAIPSGAFPWVERPGAEQPPAFHRTSMWPPSQ